jgi:hypothetical protein
MYIPLVVGESLLRSNNATAGRKSESPTTRGIYRFHLKVGYLPSKKAVFSIGKNSP